VLPPPPPLTVRVAGVLVAAGVTPLVAMQRYWVPFIVVVTAVRVSVAEVAPEMLSQVVPLVDACHW